MKIIARVLYTFAFFILGISVQAQGVISIPFTVTDNATIPNSRTVYMGLDPAATDGIDLSLGEGELPPMPPSGNFEARMFLPTFTGSLASYRDYRAGTQFQNGTFEYRLRYQKQATATNIKIEWQIPANISGVLKDVATNGIIINVPISGNGSYTVTNPTSFNQLKVFLTYSLGPTTIAVKAVPEGMYNSGTGTLNMSDTFKVYLANVTAPNAFVDSANVILDSVTFTGTTSMYNAPTGNYYVVLSGRNIIQTWSREGGETFTKGGSYLYNFDSLQTQAYGSNLKSIDAHWCVYSGDVNQDGFIDFSDLTMIDNDSYNFTSGYVVTDVNGDMFVDFSDLTLVDNNSYNFIGVVRP